MTWKDSRRCLIPTDQTFFRAFVSILIPFAETSLHKVGRMFRITLRPPVVNLGFEDETPSTHRKHPAELDAMDVDGNIHGEGPSSLRRTVVGPGEIITSSREYMR